MPIFFKKVKITQFWLLLVHHCARSEKEKNWNFFRPEKYSKIGKTDRRRRVFSISIPNPPSSNRLKLQYIEGMDTWSANRSPEIYRNFFGNNIGPTLSSFRGCQNHCCRLERSVLSWRSLKTLEIDATTFVFEINF